MKRFFTRLSLFIVAFCLIYLLWKSLIWFFHYPIYILPNPYLVWQETVALFTTGKIYPHLTTTLTEVIFGFVIGFCVALILGYIFGKKEWLHITFAPYIVALQAIPIVALAPLFILWFGSGIASKIAICAIIVFFPVMVNTIAAITNIDQDKKELMKTYNASFTDNLIKLEIPHSLPYLFSSIKIGLVLSIVGTVVGEFMGADRGLGFLINASLGLFDTPQLFAIIFTLAVLGILLYGTCSALELSLGKKDKP